jgi:hypothetical protein
MTFTRPVASTQTHKPASQPASKKQTKTTNTKQPTTDKQTNKQQPNQEPFTIAGGTSCAFEPTNF